jgi:hypothetical protein
MLEMGLWWGGGNMGYGWKMGDGGRWDDGRERRRGKIRVEKEKRGMRGVIVCRYFGCGGRMARSVNAI